MAKKQAKGRQTELDNAVKQMKEKIKGDKKELLLILSDPVRLTKIIMGVAMREARQIAKQVGQEYANDLATMLEAHGHVGDKVMLPMKERRRKALFTDEPALREEILSDIKRLNELVRDIEKGERLLDEA